MDIKKHVRQYVLTCSCTKEKCKTKNNAGGAAGGEVLDLLAVTTELNHVMPLKLLGFDGD